MSAGLHDPRNPPRRCDAGALSTPMKLKIYYLFTTARHLPLSWARWLQSTPPIRFL